MKKAIALIMALVILLTIMPVQTQAATASNRRSYAYEMMKAAGTKDVVIIVPGTKNKDGSRQGKAYHYHMDGKKARLAKSWTVLIGRYVKWSKSRVYYIGHGKKRVDLTYHESINGYDNLCKMRYYMMAEGRVTLSAYVRYKATDNSLKYAKTWSEDTTGLRNNTNIGMPYKWAKYIWNLGTGLPMVFI